MDQTPPPPMRRSRNPFTIVGRQLPKGWGDFGLQLLIFAAFQVGYEISRGLATGQRDVAFAHADDVIRAERSLGIFWELDVQAWATSVRGIALEAANWTYFNCQFTVSFLFLLWVYLRRNESWSFVRNVIISADVLGLIGYITYPTAPPRMLPALGFVDTLHTEPVNFDSKAVDLLANPYAAMPSLHTAYAITLGVTGVLLCRHAVAKAAWALYPGLVVFSIVATGNHFILDAVAGACVLALAVSIALAIALVRRRRHATVPHFEPRLEPLRT